MTSKKSKECLKLTFDELCHIRNVLTKAELDYLLFDNQLFQEVSRGKICFSCRKTKFHLFNWGQKCRICQQKICKKCLRSAQLKNGCLMAQVPMYKLQPNSQYNHNNNKHQQINATASVLSASASDTNNKNNHHHYHHYHYHHSLNDQSQSSSNDYEIISMGSGGNGGISGNGGGVGVCSAESSFVATTTSASSSPSSKACSHLFEICVDCYEMMEGVVVSANEKDLALNSATTNAVHSRRKDSTVFEKGFFLLRFF